MMIKEIKFKSIEAAMPFYVRKRPPPGSVAASDGAPREGFSRQQVFLLLGLYMGYSSMMFSRAAMDVAIPLILQDEATGIGPRDIGTLLTLCSFFYLFGKISMGYSVDQKERDDASWNSNHNGHTEGTASALPMARAS
eukprot:evm.model.NODE_4862_length_23170_cov_39.113380.2